MKFSACTHVGLVRSGNQDALAWEEFSAQPAAAFAAVADGMGGMAGGEVASQMAIAAVMAGVRQGAQHWHSQADRLEGLRQVAMAAHEALLREQERRPELAGMGTTFTGALIWGSVLHLVHTGDSRAYLLRAGSIRQLSDDHSVVGELVRGGNLTEAEAQHHPQRHLLTSALGARGPLKLDLRTVEWQAGDILLLCTDGLTNLVPADELARWAADTSCFASLAERLVHLAIERGGHDNITVLAAWDDTPGAAAGAVEEVNS